MTTPYHKNTSPGVMKFSILVGPREKDLRKQCNFSIYLIWPRPSARTPAPGVMKSTIWINPFLVMHLHVPFQNLAPE